MRVSDMTDASIGPLPLEVLGPYLERQIPTFRSLRSIVKFKGGQSNPTYRLQADSGTYVLRRKPPGQLLASAHAVDREFRVLRALAETDVPVPVAWHLCEDDTVIGSMFYIMSFVPGTIFWNPALPDLDRDARWTIFDEMNRVLSTLHDVDYQAIGLQDFGRPGDYFARQVSRWSRQYSASQTETIPEMEALVHWLPENLPPDNGMISLIHGDYRMDNLVFETEKWTVVALLDWELSTLGHPYADLAYQCMQWRLGQEEMMPGLGGLDRRPLGIPTEEEYIERYCERRGMGSIPNWPFYLAFSCFRFAAIMQGVYRRSLDGNASNDRASEYGALVKPLARLGVWLTA